MDWSDETFTSVDPRTRDFARSLLASASADQPAEDGMLRLAARLGIPGVALGTAVGVELMARGAAAAESGALGGSAAAASGTGVSGVMVSSLPGASAGVSSGAALATGSTVVTTGAASAFTVIAKALSAGVLAGALGIGAIEGVSVVQNRTARPAAALDGVERPTAELGAGDRDRQGSGAARAGISPALAGRSVTDGLRPEAVRGETSSDNAAPLLGPIGQAASPETASVGERASASVPTGSAARVESGTALHGRPAALTREPSAASEPPPSDPSNSTADPLMRGVGELPSAAPVAPVLVQPHPDQAPTALRQELALLNSARSLMQQGRGSAGLAILDDYANRFPGGALSAEALALRALGLAQLGRRADAKLAAELLVQRFPKSPHRARLVQLGLIEEGN
ncbi:MAG TPA: hypothetical protein VHM70_28295 [Polyangiaceae bacterium]|jgi:hypothetical protein|nr:hypothetical protein [Polyangiaceae bacterium]